MESKSFGFCTVRKIAPQSCGAVDESQLNDGKPLSFAFSLQKR